MALSSIEEIIADLRAGKPVILMDDEDRENEGDLIIASESVTPEHITFFARQGCGLICMTVTEERAEQLQLPLMVRDNRAPLSTNFTVSIEAAQGTTTGISAADRATTVQAAIAKDAKPTDLVMPGHIFPLIAKPGGVLTRAGHTEAGCDLARLAGFAPSAVIVEIMNEDGTMSKRDDLEKFCEKHDLKMGTIAQLIEYRLLNEKTVDQVAQQQVQTQVGEMTMTTFTDTIYGQTHFAFTKGEIKEDEPCFVRVQTISPLRDTFGLQRPESDGWSFDESMKKIHDEGGVLVVLGQDLDAANLAAQAKAFPEPVADVRVNTHPGNPAGVFALIGTGSQILREMGVGKMRLLSSPVKYSGLAGFHLEVTEYIHSPGK